MRLSKNLGKPKIFPNVKKRPSWSPFGVHLWVFFFSPKWRKNIFESPIQPFLGHFCTKKIIQMRSTVWSWNPGGNTSTFWDAQISQTPNFGGFFRKLVTNYGIFIWIKRIWWPTSVPTAPEVKTPQVSSILLGWCRRKCVWIVTSLFHPQEKTPHWYVCIYIYVRMYVCTFTYNYL